MGRYSKAIAALVGAAIIGVVDSGLVSPDEPKMMVDTIVAILTAVGVWAVPNKE